MAILVNNYKNGSEGTRRSLNCPKTRQTRICSFLMSFFT